MGNVWGVENATPLPASYGAVGGADVTLVAGAETTFITTGALASLGPGNYYPLIIGQVTLAMGAAASTALVLAFRLGSGSDVATYTVPPALLVNNATFIVPFFFVGASSATAWQGAGSTINITGLATTNNATARNVGSSAIVLLLRGPDV